MGPLIYEALNPLFELPSPEKARQSVFFSLAQRRTVSVHPTPVILDGEQLPWVETVEH